jgi:putative ATPase
VGKNVELFPNQPVSERVPHKHAPLAEQLRPKSWDEFEGLQAIDPRLIAQLRAGQGRPPSLILWGPPGSGKTTLARLIGKSFSASFVEVSAVLVGVKEIREIAERASSYSGATILFVDEIHRLNKGQQDAFLPHVENGTFVLIGATTENPSFYLTNALRSRARVVVLKGLTASELALVAERGAKALGVELEAGVAQVLEQLCGGDARQLLNTIEGLVTSGVVSSGNSLLTQSMLTEYLSGAGQAYYDRSGEEHYNMVSAFIKSMRGSDPDAALYWGFRMIESGEDPRFIVRRMIIFASEDIGNADPRALQLAVSTSEAFEKLGLPEGKIPLAQCITYLACAPKSNRSYTAMKKVVSVIAQNKKIAVPMHLRNAPTQLMKDLGYSEGYQYPHDAKDGVALGVHYLPEELQGEQFYEPSDRGVEKIFSEKLRELRAFRESAKKK